MRRIFTVVLCVLGFVLNSNGESRQVFPGQGPIAEYTRRDHWLSVYATHDANKSDMIEMNIFGNFGPGYSPKAAVARFGEPTKYIPRKRGAEYVEYATINGLIRLGSEESADGNVGHPLYYFPTDRRPELLFPEHVIRYINRTADTEVVMLYECGYAQPVIHVVLENGQVERVVWLYESELGHRSSSDQCTD